MTRWITLIFLLATTEATARPALVRSVETKFQTYTAEMEKMKKECMSEGAQNGKTPVLKCMCSYIGSLLAFKALVVQAAHEHPNKRVTLRVKGKSKSVKLANLAGSLEETKKLQTMCSDPEATSLGLQAFAIKAKQSVTKSRLSHLYSMQQLHYHESDTYGKFPPLGAGEKKCRFKELLIDLGECKKDPYRYSIVVAKNGRSFKSRHEH